MWRCAPSHGKWNKIIKFDLSVKLWEEIRFLQDPPKVYSFYAIRFLYVSQKKSRNKVCLEPHDTYVLFRTFFFHVYIKLFSLSSDPCDLILSATCAEKQNTSQDMDGFSINYWLNYKPIINTKTKYFTKLWAKTVVIGRIFLWWQSYDTLAMNNHQNSNPNSFSLKTAVREQQSGLVLKIQQNKISSSLGFYINVVKIRSNRN